MEDWWKEPFVWGLALGLFFCACIVYVGASRYFQLRGELKARRDEIKTLKDHLNTQMSITARGTEDLRKESEQLRSQNENLRINLESLQRKPGRGELRTLHLYDKALRILHEQAPGFAPAWERALQQAEREMKDAEGGLSKLISKVFRPGSQPSASLPESTDAGSEDSEAEISPEEKAFKKQTGKDGL